ncbi:MAG TPA: hypothetical protein VLG09_05115 [Candidatus Saccharimonadales bacterium]|nr:hypothetical protein [Candidatus Saccharimonadales bacterium]
MSEYLGFIALVPRKAAGQWVQRHTPPPAVPILQAFASDATWEEDQLTLPALGRRLVLALGGATYTARQYTAHGSDVLVVACNYTREWIGPGGKFTADVELHRAEGVTLTEIVDGDLDEQIKQALLRA